MRYLMSAIGTKRTSASALHMSAFDPKRKSTFVRLIRESEPCGKQTHQELIAGSAVGEPQTGTNE